MAKNFEKLIFGGQHCCLGFTPRRNLHEPYRLGDGRAEEWVPACTRSYCPSAQSIEYLPMLACAKVEV
jgi:hypothetical protein